jgi:protein-S-isoprenylcysteine O-methyltransferase Ste14
MNNTETSAPPASEPLSTGDILRRLPIIAAYVVIMGALLFGLSGHLDWGLGWLYLGAYVALIVIGLLAPLDRAYLEERTQLKADVKTWDKRLNTFAGLLSPLGLLVVAALDERYGWSADIPLWLALAALAVGVLGYLLSIWASAVNRFYARYVRIQKERGHTTITGGPYRTIRHPGYAGQIVFNLASALALGSWWTLIPGGLVALLLVVRTALEDRMLQDELPGYTDYARQTRYRLLPGVW